MQGKVQKYYDLKGYGFILEGFKTRLFFHVREWKSDVVPQVGALVSYDVAPPHKPGQCNQAVNIVPVESVIGGAL